MWRLCCHWLNKIFIVMRSILDHPSISIYIKVLSVSHSMELADQKCYWHWVLDNDICWMDHFDGLVQERHNSIANALELRLSCTNPSICVCPLQLTCCRCLKWTQPSPSLLLPYSQSFWRWSVSCVHSSMGLCEAEIQVLCKAWF